MIKQLSIALFICLAFSCAPGRSVKKNTSILNGTWVLIKQEIDGTSLSKPGFQNQKLIILDSTYTHTAESIDKGQIRYRANKMDIYGKEGINVGKHFTAIYRLENEELSICYNLYGDRYPETFETKGKRMYYLSVFKKELKK